MEASHHDYVFVRGSDHLIHGVDDIDDTEVIWIAFIRDTQINWFYLKIEQIKYNISNYQY